MFRNDADPSTTSPHASILDEAMIEADYHTHTTYTTPADNLSGLARRLNRSDAERAAAGFIDYNVHNKLFNLGGAEFNGRRVAGSYLKAYEEAFASTHRAQEDRMAFDEIQHFDLLSTAAQNQVIQQTINTLQVEINEQWSSVGSCLHTNIIVPELAKKQYTVININLGDSFSLLGQVRIAPSLSAQQLLSNLAEAHDHHCSVMQINTRHVPSVPTEKIRLNAFPALIKDRVGGVLAISRAMGNDRLHKFGLTHSAEITRHVVLIEDPEHMTYLISACDGLDDKGAMTNNLLAHILKSHLTEPSLAASNLARTAILKLSEDNVSTLVIPLSHRERPLAKPLAISIYDGHGGAEVATILQRKFLAHLSALTTFTAYKEVRATMARLENKNEVDYALLKRYALLVKQAMVAKSEFHYFKLIKLADLVQQEFVAQHSHAMLHGIRLFNATYSEHQRTRFKHLLTEFNALATTVKLSAGVCFSSTQLKHQEHRQTILHFCDDYLSAHQQTLEDGEESPSQASVRLSGSFNRPGTLP